MHDVQTRRQPDPSSHQIATTEVDFVPNEDIQFGYHNTISGEQIRIINSGLGAERMNPTKVYGHGVAYGAHPLKGNAEFEVKIDSYGAGWLMSITFGVMRCKKGMSIDSGKGVPFAGDNYDYFTWSGVHVLDHSFTSFTENNINIDQFMYGSVDLRDLREGDRVGLRISEDGALEFTVNGEGQGIAAKNIYTRDSDVYAVVDHYGQCVATVITKAGNFTLFTCVIA